MRDRENERDGEIENTDGLNFIKSKEKFILNIRTCVHMAMLAAFYQHTVVLITVNRCFPACGAVEMDGCVKSSGYVPTPVLMMRTASVCSHDYRLTPCSLQLW